MLCLEATVTTYFTLGLTKYSGLIYKKNNFRETNFVMYIEKDSNAGLRRIIVSALLFTVNS